MKRLLSIVFCLGFVLSTLPGTATVLKEETLCSDDVRLRQITVTSETFECCNQDDRFTAAASAVKDAHYQVAEYCKENNCEFSAIARICVSYEQVTREKCVAVAKVWFTCCCCVFNAVALTDRCPIDWDVCAQNSIQTISDRDKYECCDIDDRWNSTYNTMKAAYKAAYDRCSVLDCRGSLYVRGFTIEYAPYTDDGICIVGSTIYYSCCCVCE